MTNGECEIALSVAAAMRIAIGTVTCQLDADVYRA